jgi:hypothetical protein
MNREGFNRGLRGWEKPYLLCNSRVSRVLYESRIRPSNWELSPVTISVIEAEPVLALICYVFILSQKPTRR